MSITFYKVWACKERNLWPFIFTQSNDWDDKSSAFWSAQLFLSWFGQTLSCWKRQFPHRPKTTLYFKALMTPCNNKWETNEPTASQILHTTFKSGHEGHVYIQYNKTYIQKWFRLFLLDELLVVPINWGKEKSSHLTYFSS